MAKRNRKAQRTNRKNAQARPSTPVSFAPPAVEERGTDSLAGAILAAVASSRETVPEVPLSKAVHAEEAPIVVQPIIDVVAAPTETPAVESQPEASPGRGEQAKPVESLEDDDFDEAFFAQPAIDEREARAKQESLPPTVEDILAPKTVAPPSPEVLARRSRLRKVVGAIVAIAAVVVIGGVGKNLLAGERTLANHAVTAAVHHEPAAAAPAPSPAVEVVSAPAAAVAAEPKEVVAQQSAKEEAPVAEPTGTKPAEAKPASAVPEGVDAKAEALRLLNMGKVKDAVPMARSAIAADPSDALPYLYLGTALQELGQNKDAMGAYNECVRNATKGRVWECRAMGGKK